MRKGLDLMMYLSTRSWLEGPWGCVAKSSEGVHHSPHIQSPSSTEAPAFSNYRSTLVPLAIARFFLLTPRCRSELGVRLLTSQIWIVPGDIILLSLRDFQDDRADVIHKYTADEARNLKTYGELKSDFSINENADGGESESESRAASGERSEQASQRGARSATARGDHQAFTNVSS